MAQDDFIVDDTQQNTGQQNDDVQTFNIGGIEYTAEQLEKYISLGKIGEEAETRFNTKLDKVWPEYTKTSQELKATKERLDELEALAEQQQQETPITDINQEQAIREAKQAAKKIGLVTDDDFEELLSNAFRKYYIQERESERIYNEAVEMSNKYNGSDGRPAFDVQDMLEYMVENNIADSGIAYKIRYEKELDAWKEQQLSKSKKSGMVTEEGSSAGFKTAPDIKPNKDNLGQLISESLGLTAE